METEFASSVVDLHTIPLRNSSVLCAKSNGKVVARGGGGGGGGEAGELEGLGGCSEW